MSVITNGLLGQGTGLSHQSGSATVQNPATTAQATTAYNQSQDALTQQQNFLAATQAQNGLGNQSSVYNQLGNIAAGQGPNPAQAMLAQNTGANVANQAALMAGQRGANQNAGLIARQAAQQGAATQQQAVGQGATMQAQQSLAALGQQAGIAGQQVGQQAAATGANTGATQSEQQNLLNSIAQQNNANVGIQSNINTVQGSLANTAAAGQMQLLGNVAGGAGAALGLAEGGRVPGYDDGGVVQPQQPAAPTAPTVSSTGPKSKVGNIFAGNTSTSGQTGMGAAGSAIGAALGKGISALFSSNSNPSSNPTGNGGYNQYSQSGLDPAEMQQDSMRQTAAQMGGIPTGPDLGTSGGMNLGNAVAGAFAEGGDVPALVSPGEVYLPPNDVEKVKKGANPLAVGEKIPGKPKYPGNDYRNDTTKKTLKEGGVVIPNKILQGANPGWESMKFVHAHMRMAKGGLVSKKKRK